ncbi:SDR family NAD(P)-dependent oxidoreductase [Ktedonosporobacter rubrisoli]|uniref:SDR family NAD(P)-dependent oxidoreductase n=1 Tax=Ktedonosporobacter rubrisoli TaxID=2509675 RepID=A0A4P6JHR8_KTERU|nr:SDR family NAD(P)-dependent oxidoreductase [Ktedonosporobacter rubrisoli]QBD74579.1 SDR family NAD(P)-dependent oxidoreductase [Ktedonosporobacter rubrisoli]
MDLGLQDKVVIVTGGSAGIGQATAVAFAGEGAKVTAVGRSIEPLRKTVSEIEAAGGEGLAVVADLNQLEDVKRVVEETVSRFGHIDILFNNAGSAMGGPFLEIPDEQWMAAMQLKFFGYMRLTREVIPHLIEAGGGRIINVIGAFGKEPSPSFLPGAATNAAIRNFTKGLALTLKPHNILVNAISPSLTRTQRAVRLLEQQAEMSGLSVEQLEQERSADFVGGHMTKPEEIAALALFLASKQVVTLTGAEIDVNGGTSHSI